ncbi:MAG: hypothetical protein HZA92_07050 [Verrucomicrobia bacterium]|nr:hypothetical protein [Verrucomicrobiota bacterium]
MKLLLFPALALTLAITACSPDPKPEPKKEPSKLGENPVAAPLDYIAAIGKAQRASISRLDQSKLIDAIQKFEAGESRPPKTLDELVTMKYIAAIPPAPKGMRLEYTAADGSFMYVPIAPAPAGKK